MLDTTNPVDPVPVGHLDLGHNARRLARINGHVVASGVLESTIGVIEVQASGPVIATSFDNQFLAGDLAVQGNLLYVASGSLGGLRIHYMSDPLAPQFAGEYVPAGESVAQVAVDGDFAYAGWANDDTLIVIDVGNPAVPDGIGDYSLQSGAADIAASGSHVFAGTTLHGVRVLHHDGLGTLSEVAVIDVSPAVVTGVDVDADRLYLSAGMFSGLLVYDISDPADPQFVEQHNTAGDGRGLDAFNGVIAMAEGVSGASVFGCDVGSVNTAPVTVGVIGDQESEEGDVIFPLSVHPNFDDPDRQALIYAATGLPPGLAIGTGSGVIEGYLDHSTIRPPAAIPSRSPRPIRLP